jgi:transposase-like protein
MGRGNLAFYGQALKTGSNRKCTPEFQQAAVNHVVDGGRSMPQVAWPLETLANRT